MRAASSHRTSRSQPDEVRRVAESFGSDADRYDRARPRCPAALLERIVDGTPGLEVVDVGTGTGIVARQLQAAGCRVLGVDVDARMAEVASSSGVPVEVARFEEWDPAGRRFDTVVAGQSWHWVDAVAGATKAAQVLRQGGRLVAFWNVFQAPPELARAFDEVYALCSLPFSMSWTAPALETYEPMFDRASVGIMDAGGFGDPQRWTFGWTHPFGRDEWLDQVPTHGDANRLPPKELAQLLDGLGSAVDAAGGAFTMDCTTVAVVASRVGA